MRSPFVFMVNSFLLFSNSKIWWKYRKNSFFKFRCPILQKTCSSSTWKSVWRILEWPAWLLLLQKTLGLFYSSWFSIEFNGRREKTLYFYLKNVPPELVGNWSYWIWEINHIFSLPRALKDWECFQKFYYWYYKSLKPTHPSPAKIDKSNFQKSCTN